MLGQCPRGSPSPLFYGVICSRPNDDLSCQHQMYKKMVFPAAIREKSQRGVALSCDTHVVSAKSVGIRQPCTESLSETASCRTFLSVQHFCAGNSVWVRLQSAGNKLTTICVSEIMTCPGLVPGCHVCVEGETLSCMRERGNPRVLGTPTVQVCPSLVFHHEPFSVSV